MPHRDPRSAEDMLQRVGTAARELREALDCSPPGAGGMDRAAAETMTGALAQRDRGRDAIQLQADERLALIERISGEAAERLAALEQTTATLRQLEAQIARLGHECAALRQENEHLRIAAEERLELLEANDRAYAAFKARLRRQLADVSALLE